jgi:prolipoprotein diacylglyceryltransferase
LATQRELKNQQYALNSSFKYQDPNVENLVGYLCGIGQILAGGVLIVTDGILEVATLGGYTIGFGFCMFVERVKEEQSVWFSSSCMPMGQWLSIPFIVLGLVFLYRSRKVRRFGWV